LILAALLRLPRLARWVFPSGRRKRTYDDSLACRRRSPTALGSCPSAREHHCWDQRGHDAREPGRRAQSGSVRIGRSDRLRGGRNPAPSLNGSRRTAPSHSGRPRRAGGGPRVAVREVQPGGSRAHRPPSRTGSSASFASGCPQVGRRVLPATRLAPVPLPRARRPGWAVCVLVHPEIRLRRTEGAVGL
jgi:hypothetical protein